MNQIFVVAFVVVAFIIVIIIVIVVVAAVAAVVVFYIVFYQFSHTLKININLSAYCTILQMDFVFYYAFQLVFLALLQLFLLTIFFQQIFMGSLYIFIGIFQHLFAKFCTNFYVLHNLFSFFIYFFIMIL